MVDADRLEAKPVGVIVRKVTFCMSMPHTVVPLWPAKEAPD